MDRPGDGVVDALVSGLAGAATLTLIHETARHTIPDAPRMDTLARRTLVRALESLGIEPPPFLAVQGMALAGDLVANSLYYALVGLGPARSALARGALLGSAAGLGAVALPPVLGLGRKPGAATPQTMAMTFAWYLAGGLAAGAAFRQLEDARSS